jgi:hypothetical protein
MSLPAPKQCWSYASARLRQDAIDAAHSALGWLDELAGVDLGHVGDHVVAEAKKNVEAVAAFLRRPEIPDPRS